jgi:hypothetical protein
VIAVYNAASGRNPGGPNVLYPRVFQAQRRTHDIHYGIHPAHFMKMHTLFGTAVYSGLSISQMFENTQTGLFDVPFTLSGFNEFRYPAVIPSFVFIDYMDQDFCAVRPW